MPADTSPRWRRAPTRAALAAALLGVALAVGLAPQTPAQAQPQRNLEVVQLQLPGQPAQRLYGESHALVIGASKYRNGWSRLPGVPGDVAAVSKLLRQQGFTTVKELNDPSYAELDAALRDFITERGGRPDNRLLVYFAGHGHTLTTAAGNKIGYIVPVDAPRPDQPRFRALAYSMQQVEALARQTEAKHVLFLFDSCFSGTIFRTRQGVPDSISQRTAQPVRQFITAGDENQPVPDESVFRRQLEEGLGQGAADLNKDGYITGSELGMFLEDRVINYTRAAQTPRYGKIQDPNLDKGDFVFVTPLRPEPHLATQAPIQVAPPVSVALQTQPSAADLVPAIRPLRPGELLKDCGDCPELVVIPPGSFDMGSPPSERGRSDSEGPEHTVVIPRLLAVGRHEVTKAQFAKFVMATGFRTDAERDTTGRGCRAWDINTRRLEWKLGLSWRTPGWQQLDQEPVVCVSWSDAQAYVQWLNRTAPGRGYRLLSEAEWEYAARAHSRTSVPWLDDDRASQQCAFANAADGTPGPSTWSNRADCSDGHWFAAPSASFRPNGFGLHDMHGNVWEWVEDMWHSNYIDAPSDGTAWMQGGDSARRVFRGGSWASSPLGLRSANRVPATVDDRINGLGFRIARHL